MTTNGKVYGALPYEEMIFNFKNKFNMSDKNKNTEQTGNDTIHSVKHRCILIPYGDEEMRCIKCGYITWVDKNKTSNEIIEDMINSGYEVPKCDLNGA